MKIALAGTDSRYGGLLLQIKKTLDSLNINTQLMKNTDYKLANEVDLVLVAGGDRGILDYFHKVVTDSAPVLGIYESDSTGFLAQLEVRDLESAISRLKRSNYEVDEVVRLAVKVDSKEMEHVLRIEGKDVWHDNSDGVIISTPTGSTAYSMSAGGPMVLQRAPVYIVVSVNSVDNTRRPLVVPNDTKLEISDIMSRYHCEVVLDGGSRLGIRKMLECYRHEFPARLVRLIDDSSSATSIIAKKVKLAKDLLSIPPSAKLILKTLEYEGTLSQKDLSTRTMLPERTVRLSLSHLLNLGYVKKKTSLRDARQKIYELDLKEE